MKQTGILFKAEMVRARLAGLKTQTRRLVKPQPDHVNKLGIPFFPHGKGPVDYRLCPYGGAGDLLWVKETHARVHPGMLQSLDPDPDSPLWETVYRADTHGGYVESLLRCTKWRPSIFMPRRFSRITLEIISVRVERLQDITEEDAIAEGCSPELRAEGTLYRGPNHPVKRTHKVYPCAKAAYRALWESINGPGSWDLNPWLWVIEFKEVKP